MKYLALLSGGKDSCFNLLHCAKNGHELVAAASLGPGAGQEEIDSYLYQTVGQDAIEFVAQALDVPLYRRVITGEAVEQGAEYGSRDANETGYVEGDETEDLFALLSDVKSRHPDIQGVSVGAILSNYQRVRVEHVCHRLGLTPLCYLWNRNQEELLTEMINAGMQAVLIKVAGIGLHTQHLGRTLSEMQSTLVKLNQLYGAHICGEGGEYETLTLDCPIFKRRIVLARVETVIHSDNDFATVAFLRIKAAVLEAKPPSGAFQLQIPPLLSKKDMILHDAVLACQGNFIKAEDHNVAEMIQSLHPSVSIADSRRVGAWVYISNIERTVQDPPLDLSLEAEVNECLQLLQAQLGKHSLRFSNCININILLSSIDSFSRVNAVYAKFFGSSPPARACVAVELPHPIRVRLDCIAFAGENFHRQALHVQGLSYWAPANIGPYSQAITATERIFISGQIGLIPSQLNLPSPQSLALETALSSRHVSRINDVLKINSGVGWTGFTQLALHWFKDANDLRHIKKVHSISPEIPRGPTLYLSVEALPKHALIEKQVLLHTGRRGVPDDNEDDDYMMQSCNPTFLHHHEYVTRGLTLEWEVSHIEGDDACSIICVKGEENPLLVDRIRNIKSRLDLSAIFERSLSIRLFYVPSRMSTFTSVVQGIFEGGPCPPTTPVPCHYISTNGVDDWDYALCIIHA